MALWRCLDGNEAAALVAHRLSDVCAIYPITPASPMGELADAWSAAGRTNLWGSVPTVVEMQSEGGAAGALHGALQKGVLATTFTSSQGLLLMLPNMYKIAGELTPAVIHVAARALATHALSIFGDHSDVMSARGTGWALLSASSVQEAHDFALVSHVATLRTRVPFLHFFDGFRTSHEVDKISLLDDDDLRALVRVDDILDHRARGLTPERPVLRGSAQNPDVFFQARESANPFYDGVAAEVQAVFDELAERTGRQYGLVDYHGVPDAERVIVIMGSGTGAVAEAVDELVARGEKVGVLTVRLYRPFPTQALLDALPGTATRIAVLDRVKEPGAPAEPLHLDVVLAVQEAGLDADVIGGRYGLGSKEFTARGQTMAHLPQSMHRSGSHTGIDSARLRFSHLAVPVGKVPSTGSALTGSRSPSPARMRAVTCWKKSGAPTATEAIRRPVDSASAGTSMRCISLSARSIAAWLRSTIVRPRRP